MKKYFVTGVSGTGKSTISKELRKRKIPCFEIESCCSFKDKLTGMSPPKHAEEDDEAFHEQYDWFCNVQKLENALNSYSGDYVVALGVSSNQNDFLSLFDQIIVLQSNRETLEHRLLTRKANTWGKKEYQRNIVFAGYKEFENDLISRGAIGIENSGAVEETVEHIMKIISATAV